LSIDPVTTDADTGSSFNRYAYADNNPYKYVDKRLISALLIQGRIAQRCYRVAGTKCFQAAASRPKGLDP
jgi:hypothetical protein